MRYLIVFCLFSLCLNSCPTLLTAAQTDEFSPAEAIRNLDEIDRRVGKGETDVEQLNDILQRLNDWRAEGSQCVASSQAELERVTQSLEAIGPEVAKESSEIVQQRKTLLDKKATLERRLAECRLLSVHTEEVLRIVMTARRELLARRFFHKQADIRTLIMKAVQNPERSWVASKELVLHRSGLERLTLEKSALLAVLCALSAGCGLWFRRSLLSSAFVRPRESFGGLVLQAFLTTLADYAPFLLLFGGFAACLGFLTNGLTPTGYLTTLAYGLTLYLTLRVGVRTFLTHVPPAPQLTSLPQTLVRLMAQRLNALALFAPLGVVLLLPPVSEGLPEEVYELVRVCFVSLLCLGLLWLLRGLWHIPVGRLGNGLRPILALLLLVAVGSEWLGYRSLSTHLLRATLVTLFIGVLLWISSELIRELFDGLAEGRHEWQKRLRERIGVDEREFNSSLLWLRFIANSLIRIGFGLVLLAIWGVSGERFGSAYRYLTEGFEIGDVTVVPSRLITGLFLFAILWMLSRWFRNKLDKKWLAPTQLGPGAKETLVSITGYIGFILAILVALSVGGMDLSNLAIIAGALSVGIGFGLQNIVNNFVSGLILLFERPIKRGDWIVVGGTEGYVKRISVRSTVIQTFDRADVIVPNSELISTQVTNWMLDDLRGRVRVPVGVAYGSDTARVRTLLLDSARFHGLVVTDGSLPQPNVLFMGFGESSLDFELRCFIGDIDQRLAVRSDLNFAIDAAFRENGIQIPFPQRDLHVRDWPDNPQTPTNSA